MDKTGRIYFLILIIVFAVQPNSYAQIIKEKKLTDTPYVSVLQYSDDEYIYVGTERRPNSYDNDIILTKRNLNGDIEWSKTIDWDFNCTVKDAVILDDRNILIAGSARASIHESFPFVVKTNPNGEAIWKKYYQSGHQAEQVIGTSDGGYLISYYSDSSGLIKLDADGHEIWSENVGGGRPYGIAETAEAVFLMVDDENQDIVLSSIGSYGEILWKRIFGDKGFDQPADVLNASNEDDYLFAGRSYNDQTRDDFHVGLLDCFGYVNWTKSFGGKGTDLCYDLMESSDGNFIAVGTSNSFNEEGRFDFYAVKFDLYGNLIWEKTFPGVDMEDYQARNVFETSYGSLLLAGRELSDSEPFEETYLVEFIYPTQFDLSFEAVKQTITNYPYEVQFRNNTTNGEYFDFIWHFGDGESLASNESIVIHEYKQDGVFDVTLIAYENDFGSVDTLKYEDYINIQGISTSVNDIESLTSQNLKISPNPFSTSTTISFNNPDNDRYNIRIIDQSGKLVEEIKNVRSNSVEINRNNLPPGIYLVELSGKMTSRARMLIE